MPGIIDRGHSRPHWVGVRVFSVRGNGVWRWELRAAIAASRRTHLPPRLGHLRLGECLAATGISHRSHILTAGPPFVVGGSLRSLITGMAHPVEFALLSSLFCSVSLRIYSRGR
jgi:hypothetical protein